MNICMILQRMGKRGAKEVFAERSSNDEELYQEFSGGRS